MWSAPCASRSACSLSVAAVPTRVNRRTANPTPSNSNAKPPYAATSSITSPSATPRVRRHAFELLGTHAREDRVDGRTCRAGRAPGRVSEWSGNSALSSDQLAPAFTLRNTPRSVATSMASPLTWRARGFACGSGSAWPTGSHRAARSSSRCTRPSATSHSRVGSLRSNARASTRAGACSSTRQWRAPSMLVHTRPAASARSSSGRTGEATSALTGSAPMAWPTRVQLRPPSSLRCRPAQPAR